MEKMGLKVTIKMDDVTDRNKFMREIPNYSAAKRPRRRGAFFQCTLCKTKWEVSSRVMAPPQAASINNENGVCSHD